MDKPIKLIIFDLDGVLVDAKEIHYQALNKALEKHGSRFVIQRNEHFFIYDGLPTRKKLQLLTSNKGLPAETYDQIWHDKQDHTIEVINSSLKIDHRLCDVLKALRKKYRIYVASNSIRETMKLMLIRTGLIEYVDYFISNEDVVHPKPHSEIYLRCMVHAGVNPKECLVVEDSSQGRKAALEAGAHLFGIERMDEVTYENIMQQIISVDSNRQKWRSDKLNVLIPMAGAGKRFQAAGYTFPKPLIDVLGKPMIQLVVENLGLEGKFIFIVQQEHYDQYNLKQMLNLIRPGCEVVCTQGLTEGAACTTLLAKHLIDSDHHLLIANSDQFIDWDSSEFMYSMCASDIDGGILTFNATHPKWSYVKLDDNGFVCQVAEKIPISNIANVGIYYWNKGSDYVKYAEQMIEKDVRTNNEFYVAPVYNEAISDGKKIRHYQIREMWGLGTPEDLEHYLRNHK